MNDADLSEHMLAYRAALAAGHRIILTCHSQGCLYTEQAYFRMTEGEREQALFVTVVTPAAGVPGEGPNTRLYEDALAGLFFVDAVLPNVANAENCIGNTTDRWTCHGMETSYLHGTNSRTEIVQNIVDALLPPVQTATVQGITYLEFFNIDTFEFETVIEGGVTLGLYDEATNVLLVETVSNGSGSYSMHAPVCGSCYLFAEKEIHTDPYFFYAFSVLPVPPIVSGGIYTVDMTIASEPVVQ